MAGRYALPIPGKGIASGNDNNSQWFETAGIEMHGLVNRCLEAFLRDAYGDETWAGIAERAGVDSAGFLSWAPSPDAVTRSVLVAAARRLRKPPGELLEDIGAWLTQQEQIRRILRFSGQTYQEFVESLQELSGRVNLVLPGLEVSDFQIRLHGPDCYRLTTVGRQRRTLHVIAGLLRGMADDFGVLAVVLAGRHYAEVGIALAHFSNERGFTLVPIRA